MGLISDNVHVLQPLQRNFEALQNFVSIRFYWESNGKYPSHKLWNGFNVELI
jgi:hypothetical protein